MIFLGICDICSTFVHSITTGIFGIMGVVYCDFPLVIFILGSLGLGSWMGCCVSSIVLAVIRAGDVDSNRWIMRIFDGLKIYIVLGICLAYFLITIFLVKPVVFNENYSSWFTDPGLGHDVYDMLIFIAHFGWQCSSGAVCVVYLTLNNSIRQTVKKLFCTPPVSTVPSNMFTVVI
ncbi:7TM_GPCR_Srx domain-containing protein [Caenorhabditis elegans]|nr:7TM_GPCR_Srx domain-containing protein [Caenorhabditis elegans]CTQ86810.1 7TM_GPCR_Srx domain-containing protein [Caenorhabditis elegans]|eukprot:NP_001300111.1 Serpentine Receptor, class T [Caenorhabditis elegans]